VRAGTCGACWQAWKDQQVILMNEAQLSPADPEHYAKLVVAMREFLSL